MLTRFGKPLNSAGVKVFRTCAFPFQCFFLHLMRDLHHGGHCLGVHLCSRHDKSGRSACGGCCSRAVVCWGGGVWRAWFQGVQVCRKRAVVVDVTVMIHFNPYLIPNIRANVKALCQSKVTKRGTKAVMISICMNKIPSKCPWSWDTNPYYSPLTALYGYLLCYNFWPLGEFAR